ncbi:hypothetical protein M3Y97_00462300 [Aphelenchoides bicaudatus]|nr:hypothetical protein M3Y97_00462300 [Aphelenchoides bicaudatus]
MNQHRSKQRPWLCSLKVVTFFALLQTASALTPFEDYEKCVKSENFGKSGLICDPEHTLKNSTIEKLDALLKNLQENAKRPSRCSNTNETQKYIGLLQVSESSQIADSGSSLKDIAKRIYDSIGLGNTDCDNGVLIFYLRDKQQLATYNGNGHFVQLSNADIDKLHKLSGRDDEGGALALQFLRDNQANSDNDLQRAESWAPVVGLTAAVVLVFLILALCLAIFLARFCCCASRSKKNKYYVTPVPTYKTVDPIYIVTPPVSERHGPHSDIIYSTPYSGTPLPPSAPVYGPSPYYSSSHAPTPRSNYGRSITSDIGRSGTAASKHSNATYHTVNNSSATTLPAVESSPERGDLPFLDPKRKQEVQTREDFIA